jgi:cell division control protein 45
LNRFGQAFQEVVDETAARVRIDSFEHSVVEVKKEDLAGFLEALSLKSVVG